MIDEYCETCGRKAKFCIRQVDGAYGHMTARHEPACGYHRYRYISPAYASVEVTCQPINECEDHAARPTQGAEPC